MGGGRVGQGLEGWMEGGVGGLGRVKGRGNVFGKTKKVA